MLGELHANIEMFLFSVLEKQGKEKGCHVAGWVSYSATTVFKLFSGLLLIDRLHHTDNKTTNKDENNVINILLQLKIVNSVK